MGRRQPAQRGGVAGTLPQLWAKRAAAPAPAPVLAPEVIDLDPSDDDADAACEAYGPPRDENEGLAANASQPRPSQASCSDPVRCSAPDAPSSCHSVPAFAPTELELSSSRQAAPLSAEERQGLRRSWSFLSAAPASGAGSNAKKRRKTAPGRPAQDPPRRAGAPAAPGPPARARGAEDLGEELLAEIFEQLSAHELVAARRVCRAWARAAAAPRFLWRRRLAALEDGEPEAAGRARGRRRRTRRGAAGAASRDCWATRGSPRRPAASCGGLRVRLGAGAAGAGRVRAPRRPEAAHAVACALRTAPTPNPLRLAPKAHVLCRALAAPPRPCGGPGTPRALTEQQRRVVRHDVPPGAIVKVEALAGTGKTTVLREYALARPKKRFLYVCYNRDLAASAQGTFPKNVTCTTLHAMAFAAVGKGYRAKLRGSLPVRAVMRALGVQSPFEAAHARRGLLTFLASADPEPAEAHLPEAARNGPKAGALLGLARELWRRMRDPADEAVPMLHDGYLKLFAASPPALERSYDLVFLDEAQDSNPLTARVLLGQRVGVLVVGDPHQQLYSFRGAADAMASIRGPARVFPLTARPAPAPAAPAPAPRAPRGRGSEGGGGGSFRGPDAVVPGLSVEEAVAACPSAPPRMARPAPARLLALTGPAPRSALLARSNGALFAAAARLAPSGLRACLEGGGEGELVEGLWDVYHLWAARPDLVRCPEVRGYGTFAELQRHAAALDDRELAARARLVARHGNGIPQMIADVLAMLAPRAEATVALSTAHRSKGLEYPAVVLLDDFQDVVPLLAPQHLSPAEHARLCDEANVLYVAATRARRLLVPNAALSSLLAAAPGAGPWLGAPAGAPAGPAGRLCGACGPTVAPRLCELLALPAG
eukprot:tig00020938_g16132.t1